MTEHLFDHARGLAVAIAAGLGFDRSLSLFAQTVPGLDEAYMMQLAEKGGGWVVLLIVLFFYRRDYQRLTNSENEVRKELLAAASRQAESEQRLAVALAANTEVMRSFVAQRNGEEYDDEGRR